jgi:hypothetical protein
MSEPSITRRDLLKAGALGTVGLAAGGSVLALPGLTQGDAAAAQGQASHHDIMTVGQLAPGSADPTKFLTEFDTGRVSRLTSGNDLGHDFAADRAGYLYLMDGAATLNGEKVGAGDAAKIEHGAETLEVTAVEDAELILVDVPREFDAVGVWAAR